MDKLKPKSENKKRNFFPDVNKGSRSPVVGAIIGTFIALTPLFWSLHESVPDKAVWDTFFGTYESLEWESARYAMWVLTGKLIPLLLLLIWFFTNKNWWYHALLVPIILYIKQIYGTIQADLNYIDEVQFIGMLPIISIVIPSIYLIRARMFNKINNADKTIQELEDEFMMKPKGVWNTIKQYF
jgi:hypothetical protein